MILSDLPLACRARTHAPCTTRPAALAYARTQAPMRTHPAPNVRRAATDVGGTP